MGVKQSTMDAFDSSAARCFVSICLGHVVAEVRFAASLASHGDETTVHAIPVHDSGIDQGKILASGRIDA